MAACRGLSRGGFRVGAAAAERPAVTHWSRCCARRLFTADPRAQPGSFLEDVGALVGTGDFDVLLPGSEASLVVLSERRDLLGDRVRLGLPSHDVVERCIDKVALVGESEAAGLATPETVVCAGGDEARDAARALGPPVILKSRRSFVRQRDRLIQTPTIVVHEASAIMDAAARLGVPFLVQRFDLRARILSFSGVFAAGQLRAFALSRYERTWPVEAGPSSFAETVTPPAELVERVEQMLRRFGWEGIFQLQLLEQPGGSWSALDFNPRIFGSLALPIAAGANLPAVWCDWLLGRERPLAVAEAGVRYRWEGGDLRNAVQHLRRRRLGAALSAISPRSGVDHALFERRDPAPLLAAAVSVVRRRYRS